MGDADLRILMQQGRASKQAKEQSKTTRRLANLEARQELHKVLANRILARHFDRSTAAAKRGEGRSLIFKLKPGRDYNSNLYSRELQLHELEGVAKIVAEKLKSMNCTVRALDNHDGMGMKSWIELWHIWEQ